MAEEYLPVIRAECRVLHMSDLMDTFFAVSEAALLSEAVIRETFKIESRSLQIGKTGEDRDNRGSRCFDRSNIGNVNRWTGSPKLGSISEPKTTA